MIVTFDNIDYEVPDSILSKFKNVELIQYKKQEQYNKSIYSVEIIPWIKKREIEAYNGVKLYHFKDLFDLLEISSPLKKKTQTIFDAEQILLAASWIGVLDNLYELNNNVNNYYSRAHMWPEVFRTSPKLNPPICTWNENDTTINDILIKKGVIGRTHTGICYFDAR